MDVHQPENDVFSYHLLAENIHLLTIHTATVEAVHLCFRQLHTIFAIALPYKPLLLLSDIREAGMPPLVPLWQHSQRLHAKYPHPPTICNAVLHNLSGIKYLSFLRVMEQLAELFGAHTGFFTADEAELAISWLLLRAELLDK
jgi:hypothetical protein